jgi:predicted RNase H-like HicB family nuclease
MRIALDDAAALRSASFVDRMKVMDRKRSVKAMRKNDVPSKRAATGRLVPRTHKAKTEAVAAAGRTLHKGGSEKLTVNGRSFDVKYERDEEGWLVGTVAELPGCYSQARTAEQLAGRLQEAIAAALDERRRISDPQPRRRAMHG